MYVLRPASLGDIPVIHRLQNIPYREKVFIEPLPALEEFLRISEEKMHGEQFYYMFEQDSAPLGFIEYRQKHETTSIWGRWLNTLVYGCAVLAFDDLQLSKLNWYTRAINKPMIKTCEKMKFRKTGEKDICNITQGFSFIAIGKLIFYELTAEEFHANRHRMKELALPVEIRFRSSFF